jgi:hypothetical protein
MEKSNIEELQISERDLDDKIYASHSEVVVSLREVCASEDEGITVTAFDSFSVFTGSVKDFIMAIGVELQSAVRENRIYDFGVVKNSDVIRWADAAKSEPAANVLMQGRPIAFIATHPDEVPFSESTSVYLVSPHQADSVRLTELIYLRKVQQFVIYTSMIARLPLGSSLEVSVTAWSEQPTQETVNSTLNPCLMGAAFLKKEAQGAVS